MKSLTLREVAALVSGTLETAEGTAVEATVTGVRPLDSAGPEDVAFLAQRRHAEEAAASRAGVILVPIKLAAPREGPLIRVADPQLAAIQVIEALELEDRRPFFEGTSPAASVDPTAELGPGVAVGPGAVIGARARVGEGTIVYPGAFVDRDTKIGKGCILGPHSSVLFDCVLGDRVELGPGCVIGSEGFGFHPTSKGVVRVPQLGNVVVGSHVSLGANTTIDRARFDSTRIGNGVAIDNLVQIAHNCSIGDHTVIAAQTGIAGGTSIGARCLIGGQVGIIGHLTIGDDTMIGAKAGLGASFEGGGMLSGYYGREHKLVLRETAAVRKLPELIERIRKLEQRSS